MSIISLSDVPFRFSRGSAIYLGGRPYRILRSFKTKGRSLVLKLEGVDSRQRAEALKGKLITVPRSESPAPSEGTYYHFQLLGLHVRTREGEDLGSIREILPTGSNDVYVVSHGGQEVLIPALASVIERIDLAHGIMVVNVPKGLR